MSETTEPPAENAIDVQLAVTMMPIEQISPYENNPRFNENAVEKVAESIRAFGFRQPIVVDADRVIIAGDTRYKAALRLGLQQVPVHVAHLTPEKAREYRLVDNRMGEIAEWDFDALHFEIGELMDIGTEIGALGFGDEIAALEQLAAEAEQVEETPAPPKPKEKSFSETVSTTKQISFNLEPDDMERLRSHLKTFDSNKNRALLAWLEASLGG